MLGAAIIIPASFILMGLATLGLSDSPLVTAIPKYRGLPVILWVFAGLAVTAIFFHLFWQVVDWVRNHLRRRSTDAKPTALAVRSVDRRPLEVRSVSPSPWRASGVTIRRRRTRRGPASR